MDLIWYDFDPESRILRVAFVNEDGITGVTCRLCPAVRGDDGGAGFPGQPGVVLHPLRGSRRG